VEQRLDSLRQEQIEEAPYRSIDGDWGRGLLLLCDHAENRIPPGFNALGLSHEDLGRHIAYDIGAAAVTEHLARALGVPALLTRFSRLLIDPNRGLDDPTLVMQLSDGRIVPGNAGIAPKEIEARITRYYLPYHHAVDVAIDTATAAGKPPALLWDKDPRLAMPLLEGLRTIPEAVVGDNVPYSGQLRGDTLYRHGTMRGLAHALIEIRQDLVLSPEGQEEWAGRLAAVIGKVLGCAELSPRLHAVEHHGSHVG
jgi:predicted N-formylglutamate amidohydrolase